MKREFAFRPQTEVFVNRAGNIAIVQKTDHDDAVVWFEPDQIDTLVGWLQDAKREREEEWQPEEAEAEVQMH